MTIIQIIDIATSFTEIYHDFEVELVLMQQPNGRSLYNQLIRQQVPLNTFGVYIWENTMTGEIVYIGMAGKIKTNGQLGSHSIENRLLASRGKVNGLDIQTNDYVRSFMQNNTIESLTFHIFKTNQQTPPSYVEAVLLYNFYTQNRVLPILNNSF